MIGASLLPLLIVAFTWRGGLALPGLFALAVVGLLVVVAEWRRFTYRVEGGRLVIERGVFRHRTRIVPLDRIRSVDLQAPWLHRVLGLVRVDVEAAAGGTSAAELSLAAVSADEGERLRDVLLAGSRRRAEAAFEAPRPRTLYRATPRLLALSGVTSGRHLLAPLAVIGIVVNFADDLPGGLEDRVVREVEDRLSTSLLTVAVISTAVALLAVALAVAGSLLMDWAFELTDDGERLVARRGLLTRRTVAIDRARVRGLDLRDSPLRRAFGLVGVSAIAGGIGGGRSGRTVLAPVIDGHDALRLVSALDPHARPEIALERHPATARTRRFVRAVGTPVVLGLGAVVLEWWWLALVAVALGAAAVPLAVDRYRQLGHAFDGRRLTVQEGSLRRRWTSLDPHAVVSLAVERSPTQARAGLCSIVLHLGQGAGSRRVLDCSEEQAAALLVALDAPLMGPFVALDPVPVV
jgi:putative membrane protein